MTDQAASLREALSARGFQAAVKPNHSSRVIAVSSGKGGVGKSNFSANLSIALRQLGKRVLVLDADFGLANIELILGIIPKYSIADILNGQKAIDEIITDGQAGIKFISGGSGLKELANISERQMNYLLHNFTYLDKITDMIIIDTGAGISKSVVNFIKASDEAIVVTTPEPTAMTDAYALIKTLKDEIPAAVPEISIMVNRVEDPLEGEEVFIKLQKVSSRFLDMDLKYLGSIPNDANLVRAVKEQRPAVLSYPNTGFSKAVRAIAEDLADIRETKKQDKGVLAFIKKLIKLS